MDPGNWSIHRYVSRLEAERERGGWVLVPLVDSHPSRIPRKQGCVSELFMSLLKRFGGAKE